MVSVIWQFTSIWNDFLFGVFFGGASQPMTVALNNMGDRAEGEFTNVGKKSGDRCACIPVPEAKGDAFVCRVTLQTLFTQTDPDLIKGQEVPARALMDPAVQVAFNHAKGAIPTRADIHRSATDTRAHATSAALKADAAAGAAIPTIARTNAAVVGTATNAITAFLNSDQTPEQAAAALADAIAVAR